MTITGNCHPSRRPPSIPESEWIRRWIPREGEQPHPAALARCITCHPPIRAACLELALLTAGAHDSGQGRATTEVGISLHPKDLLITTRTDSQNAGLWAGTGKEARGHLARYRAEVNHRYDPEAGCQCGSCTFAASELGDTRQSHKRAPNRNGPNATHGIQRTASRGCPCIGCDTAAKLTDLYRGRITGTADLEAAAA